MSRLPLAYFALVLFVHAASSEAGVRCPRSRSDPIPTHCPVLNPETGHAYLVGFGDDGPLGWYDARDAAASLSYQGMTGHLATITSQAEQDFLERRFILGGSESDLWLGASDAAVEGEWRWVVGPEAGEMFWQGGPDGTALGYAPWHSGEPNNWPDEDFAAIRHVDDWNDLNPDFTMYTTGYLVEFSPVPEPGTIAMMIVFCIVLGAYSVRARVPR